jgi:hypothetical protein
VAFSGFSIGTSIATPFSSGAMSEVPNGPT